ncbi:MAG TPA: hypothetical protein VFO63_10755 [Blastocatellia bacterium]|nr:hypothetical protein [Blastocatellia bacterium]
MIILRLSQIYRLIGFLVALTATLLLSATATHAQASFVETLDNVGATGSPQTGPQNLINRGWIFRNQSSPLGATSWHEGNLPESNPIWPAPQAGAGYMAVEGSSTNRSAVLKVYTADTNDLIGTLTMKGQGRYEGQFNWPANPQNIRVRSSLGGVATRAVTLR